MTPDSFVDMIKAKVTQSSIRSVIEILIKVPGRRPAEKDVQLSAWYNPLPDRDKEMLEKVVAESVDMAVFGFLCVLDGVRPVAEDDILIDFELKCKKGDEVFVLSPNKGDFLHDIYNAV